MVLTVVLCLSAGFSCMSCGGVKEKLGIVTMEAIPLTQTDCILIQKSGKTPAGKTPAREKYFIELPS